MGNGYLPAGGHSNFHCKKVCSGVKYSVCANFVVLLIDAFAFYRLSFRAGGHAGSNLCSAAALAVSACLA